jgi:hypothetical protein
MHQTRIARGAFAIAVLAAIAASAAVLATTSRGQGATGQEAQGGGATSWVAIDNLTNGLSGPDGLLNKWIFVVNATAQSNSYVLSYERDDAPRHTVLCNGTLAAGQRRWCRIATSVPRNRNVSDGYFQLRAAGAVHVSGYREAAIRRYDQSERRPSDSVYAPLPGNILQVPYDWNTGCIPKRGSGCPGSPGGGGVVSPN